MICNTVKTCNYEHEYLNMLKRHIVDGIISGVHSLDIENYSNSNKPIVALDRYLGSRIPVVGVNHETGGRLAAEALLAGGCKRVLQFQGSLAVNTPSHVRHSSFKKIMEAHKVSVISYELAWNHFDMEYFSHVVQDAFDRYTDVDGVFGVDLLALACLKEAKKRSINVPKDLRIVAYDGTYVTRLVSPSVTAVVQPIDRLAEISTELVCGLIEGKEYPENTHIVVDPVLFRGASVFSEKHKIFS
jgi:LacI family sucrose operon transcriptional repressor